MKNQTLTERVWEHAPVTSARDPVPIQTGVRTPAATLRPTHALNSREACSRLSDNSIL